ncbi:MAG: helix-turn-helix domain-containing protein [Parvibaculum sp.]
MGPTSRLLLPPEELSGCLFAAVVRDTRGAELNHEDRFNHFPASPLYCITCTIEGKIRLMPEIVGVEAARDAPPLLRVAATRPTDTPVVSWNDGPVLAISVGVYPDAWTKLAEGRKISVLLERVFQSGDDIDGHWAQFCASLASVWQEVRGSSTLPDWANVPRLADWSRALLVRAALAGSGRSVRAVERWIKRRSGQTRQSLAFYARFEELHRRSIRAKDKPLTELALDAGYSDQSHMGRAVRRATGFSPARLNRLIENEEAFWCYRLLGERF